MVSVHQGAKLYVIIFASRMRHAVVIVKVAGDWHTKQQRSRVNPRERAQEQFQFDPARRRIHVIPKCHVTTINGFSFASDSKLLRSLSVSVVLVPPALAISFDQSSCSR